MAQSATEVDANFFRLIHGLVGSQPEDESAEKRGSMRHAFSVVQWVAPHDGENFPPDEAFLDVWCHDLTQSGFSFFLPSRPDLTRLVAAFGKPPQLIHVSAEVVHCHTVLRYPSGAVEFVEGEANQTSYVSPDGETGTLMFLVGCRFCERLEKPAGE
jgi:hypothetical protein